MSKKVLSVDNKLLIVENSLILGPNVDLQDKTVTPTTEAQIVTPDEGYYGLSSVTVESGVDTSNVTATESDVLAPKVFVDSDGIERVGAIQSQEAQIIIPSTSDIILSSGLYLGGSQTIKGDSNLIAANIKKGISIFNITGSYEQQAFAFITVTYPAGSTLTCTNDTKTFEAKTTSGKWVFTIPDAGTWTVTCTANDGSGNSKSQSVSITTEGQWESVELKYRYYVFTEGVGLSADFIVADKGSGVTFAADSISLASRENKGFVLEPSIKGAKYKILSIEITGLDLHSSEAYRPTFGLSSSTKLETDFHNNSFVASVYGVTTTRTILSVDISSITADSYIKLSSYYSTWTVHNIWLE